MNHPSDPHLKDPPTKNPPMKNPSIESSSNPPQKASTNSPTLISTNPSSDSMKISNPQPRPTKSKGRGGVVLAILIALLIAALVGYWIYANAGSSPIDNGDVPTAIARKTTLTDRVIEQGELESQSTIQGKCECDNNENKIIFLAPEGKVVQKDEIVCKFDTSEITEEITERKSRVNESQTEVETAEQELKVQIDENSTSLRTAEQTLEFAELDLDKYVNGDYPVNKSDIEGAISEAQTEFDKANRDMENTRALVKRGFREYEQLREAQQVVKSANLRLKNARQKLDSLERFEHVKSKKEFTSKVTEAEHALAIAKTTSAANESKARDKLANEKRGLEIQKNRLKELEKNLAKHEMKAPQAGTLAYGYSYRDDGKVREGSVLYQSQTVFILPDMERMQVKVGVHETLVSKVRPGQNAIIKVDAFPGSVLNGKVKSVSPLSASTRWEPSNNYHVIVTIESFPKEYKLKPGMTAEVEIVVGQYDDVIAVPVQAVTTHSNHEYVFVKNTNGEFVSKRVKTGKANVSFVAIEEGLEVDSVVALDAYQRGLREFDSKEKQLTEAPEAEAPEAEVEEAEVEEAEDAEAEVPEVEVEVPEVEVPEAEVPEVEVPQAKEAVAE